jgi:3-methyladenine DNA glycosylase/8-oxoguanine DNA glycosylase
MGVDSIASRFRPAYVTRIRPALAVDLALTLGPLRRGPSDPTMQIDSQGAFWRATRTPLGPATARFAERATGIDVDAWGPGAEWVIAHSPELLGGCDSVEGFAPEGRLRALHRRLVGLRITRSRAVYEALVPTICGQRVTWVEAQASYRRMTRAWGEAAPGPEGLLLVPSPDVLALRPSHELRALGVELKRMATLRAVARRAAQLEKVADMPPSRARACLETVPGIGPWTSAHVALVALGDADAVPLGDDSLPHLVSFAFTGEPRGNDARMIELLSPFAGHRGRVIRLLLASGLRVPRFGPRRPIRHRAT